VPLMVARLVPLASGNDPMQGAGAARVGRQALKLREHSLLKGGALAGVQRPGGCQDCIKLGVA
jgi:hypothetical protein